jgi:hypothetical protein
MTKSNKVDCPCGREFTKIGYSKHKCDQKIEIFLCGFCKRDFTTETRLINHLCEKKRRFLQKDDKPVKLGFMAYARFFKLSMGKQTTYEGFAKSKMYGAFIRFGKHIVDLNALNPIGFIDFLIRSEVKIDRWTDLVMYSTYIRELNKNEPPIDAIERNFMLMQQWSVSSGEDWCDFFRKVEPPQAVMWIVNGRLSPWLIFTASSAHILLARLSPEQNQMVESAIDAGFWRLKIERHKQDVDTIRIMLAENGI